MTPLSLDGPSHLVTQARALLREMETHNFESPHELALVQPRPRHAADDQDQAVAQVTADASELDELLLSLATEKASSAMLREENDSLRHEVRKLSAELERSRSGVNAALMNGIVGHNRRPSDGAASGYHSRQPSEGPPPPRRSTAASSSRAVDSDASGTSAVDASGLTLAGAASQILMLRREVKYLQKQWNAARRDQDGSARRDEMIVLREQSAEQARRADEAVQRALVAEAQQRLLVRELGAMRAKHAAQAARIAKRSHAQSEVSSLRAQLHRASTDLMESQRELKARALREDMREQQRLEREVERRGGGHHRRNASLGGGGDAPSAALALADMQRAEAVRLLLLGGEVGALETTLDSVRAERDDFERRCTRREAADGSELESLPPEWQDRIAMAENDRVRMVSELAELKMTAETLKQEKEALLVALREAPAPPQRKGSELADEGKSSKLKFNSSMWNKLKREKPTTAS